MEEEGESCVWGNDVTSQYGLRGKGLQKQPFRLLRFTGLPAKLSKKSSYLNSRCGYVVRNRHVTRNVRDRCEESRDSVAIRIPRSCTLAVCKYIAYDRDGKIWEHHRFPLLMGREPEASLDRHQRASREGVVNSDKLWLFNCPHLIPALRVAYTRGDFWDWVGLNAHCRGIDSAL